MVSFHEGSLLGLTSLRRIDPGAAAMVAVDLLLQADGGEVVVELLLLLGLGL